MKKYIFFTNIPTPYRSSFYNELHNTNFNFEVYYQRKSENDRNWIIDLGELKHPFHIDHGLYLMIGRFHIHFNPRLIIKLLKDKEAEFIIGLAWNDIDILILAFLSRIGLIKNKMHFWSEANYLTIGSRNDNYFKNLLRKFVYKSSKGAQLSSGEMVEITFKKWGFNNLNYIPLPNTIEEELFNVSKEEIDARKENILPIFLLPVRLNEKIKGIVNFFKSIGDDNIRKSIFQIAGDGPDKEIIQTFIYNNNLENHIKLLGHCNTVNMVSLYKKANVFVLPSFSDPSPLTIIEALKMELPLLISDKCGNHFEALIEEKNGYLFDPFEPQSIKNAFEKILSRTSAWNNMGKKSSRIYDEKFNRKLVITNFINLLTAFSYHSNKINE